MTKAEVVSKIASKTGVEKVTTLAIVESFMSEIMSAVSENEAVFLRGFGTFELKERKTKVARNIKRNTSLVVPAHFVARFKPAKEFAGQVKESKVLNDKL